MIDSISVSILITMYVIIGMASGVINTRRRWRLLHSRGTYGYLTHAACGPCRSGEPLKEQWEDHKRILLWQNAALVLFWPLFFPGALCYAVYRGANSFWMLGIKEHNA